MYFYQSTGIPGMRLPLLLVLSEMIPPVVAPEKKHTARSRRKIPKRLALCTWIVGGICGIVIAVRHFREEDMEHTHIIVEELSDISGRLHTLAKHLEGDHERQHWDKACMEIDTLLRLVESRIAARGGY